MSLYIIKIVRVQRLDITDVGYFIVQSGTEGEAVRKAGSLIPGGAPTILLSLNFALLQNQEKTVYAVGWCTQIGPITEPKIEETWRNRLLTHEEFVSLDERFGSPPISKRAS